MLALFAALLRPAPAAAEDCPDDGIAFGSSQLARQYCPNLDSADKDLWWEDQILPAVQSRGTSWQCASADRKREVMEDKGLCHKAIAEESYSKADYTLRKAVSAADDQGLSDGEKLAAIQKTENDESLLLQIGMVKRDLGPQKGQALEDLWNQMEQAKGSIVSQQDSQQVAASQVTVDQRLGQLSAYLKTQPCARQDPSLTACLPAVSGGQLPAAYLRNKSETTAPDVFNPEHDDIQVDQKAPPVARTPASESDTKAEQQRAAEVRSGYTPEEARYIQEKMDSFSLFHPTQAGRQAAAEAEMNDLNAYLANDCPNALHHEGCAQIHQTCADPAHSEYDVCTQQVEILYQKIRNGQY